MPQRAILRLGDHSLGVFDPAADSKRFSFHNNPGCLQHTKGIPGGVTWGQNESITVQNNLLVAASDQCTGQDTIV